MTRCIHQLVLLSNLLSFRRVLFTCLSGVKTLFRCQLQRHYSQIYTYFNSILVTHQTPLQNWAIIHLMNFKKPQPDTRNFLMLCGFLCHQNRLTPVSGAYSRLSMYLNSFPIPPYCLVIQVLINDCMHFQGNTVVT